MEDGDELRHFEQATQSAMNDCFQLLSNAIVPLRLCVSHGALFMTALVCCRPDG
jgi:hypothetical protein